MERYDEKSCEEDISRFNKLPIDERYDKFLEFLGEIPTYLRHNKAIEDVGLEIVEESAYRFIDKIYNKCFPITNLKQIVSLKKSIQIELSMAFLHLKHMDREAWLAGYENVIALITFGLQNGDFSVLMPEALEQIDKYFICHVVGNLSQCRFMEPISEEESDLKTKVWSGMEYILSRIDDKKFASKLSKVDLSKLLPIKALILTRFERYQQALAAIKDCLKDSIKKFYTTKEYHKVLLYQCLLYEKLVPTDKGFRKSYDLLLMTRDDDNPCRVNFMAACIMHKIEMEMPDLPDVREANRVFLVNFNLRYFHKADYEDEPWFDMIAKVHDAAMKYLNQVLRIPENEGIMFSKMPIRVPPKFKNENDYAEYLLNKMIIKEAIPGNFQKGFQFPPDFELQIIQIFKLKWLHFAKVQKEFPVIDLVKILTLRAFYYFGKCEIAERPFNDLDRTIKLIESQEGKENGFDKTLFLNLIRNVNFLFDNLLLNNMPQEILFRCQEFWKDVVIVGTQKICMYKFYEAKALMQIGNYSKAHKNFKSCLDYYTKFSANEQKFFADIELSRFHMAICQMKLGQYQDAIKPFTEFSNHGLVNHFKWIKFNILELISNCYYHLDLNDKAIESFVKTIKELPSKGKCKHIKKGVKNVYHENVHSCQLILVNFAMLKKSKSNIALQSVRELMEPTPQFSCIMKGISGCLIESDVNDFFKSIDKCWQTKTFSYKTSKKIKKKWRLFKNYAFVKQHVQNLMN